MKAQDFLQYKRWAVIGDVLNADKYASRILHALEKCGYEVLGVNPRSESPDVYVDLKALPEMVEVIDLCINPKVGIEMIKQAYDLNIKNILIQPGAGSEEIIRFCEEQGMNAIEGCALVELSNRQ